MTQTKKEYIVSILFLTHLLSACTQKYQDFTATVNEGIKGFEDASISKEELVNTPYACTYVTINDETRTILVLALAEPSSEDSNTIQLKWLSTDYGMLITENGRLTKTLRLPTNNLARIKNTTSIDPLSIKGEKPNYIVWRANYDWQPNYRYNFPADIEWRFVSSGFTPTILEDKQTNYYQEKIHFPIINKTFTNHYWLDSTSHQVIRSIQYLGPGMDKIEMTILKPFLG